MRAPVNQRPVDYRPDADSRTDCDVQQVGASLSRPPSPLRERGSVDVAVKLHGHTESLLKLRAKWPAPPRGLGGCLRDGTGPKIEGAKACNSQGQK